MDNNTQIAIDTLSYAINQLTKQRNILLSNIPLFDKLKVCDWVIEKKHNKYYEVERLEKTNVILKRNNETYRITSTDINNNFRVAEHWEVEQHLEFLRVKKAFQKPQLPEFYMITVKGENGTKVRHESFDLAVKEAKRLSKFTEHRAHIMGVVAIIEPTVVQQPILEYNLIK